MGMVRLQHPTWADSTRDVDESVVERWTAQGWLVADEQPEQEPAPAPVEAGAVQTVTPTAAEAPTAADAPTAPAEAVTAEPEAGQQ